jgi:hypothetical protein
VKSPALISADIVSFVYLAEITCGDFSGHYWRRSRAKSVVFARCAHNLCGDFSGHHCGVAAKIRSFCRCGLAH